MGTSPWYYVATFAKLNDDGNPTQEYGRTQSYAQLGHLLGQIREVRGMRVGECCCLYRRENPNNPAEDDSLVLRFKTLRELSVAADILTEHTYYLRVKGGDRHVEE